MGRRLSLSRIGALPLARVGALLPGAALAQGWTLSKDRMESGELASLRLPQDAAAFYCGVIEGDETALSEMAEFSGPGIVNLVFSEAVFGTAMPEKWQQTVVRAEMAGQVIPLPPFEFDELGGSGRVARLHNDLPSIQTAIEGNDMAIVPEIVPSFLLERSALSIGLLDMIDHCAAAKAPAVQTTNVSPLRSRAEAQFGALCQGDYSIGEDAYSVGGVTGDGVDDLMVDYASLHCTSGLLTALERPACDNLICRHDVFTDAVADPLILMAFGLQPVPETPGDIHLIFDTEPCATMGLAVGCKVRMRWMNNTFATLGME